MTFFELMGSISTIALSIPIITLIVSGLAGYKSFPALLIYSALLFTYNFLLLGYIDLGRDVKFYHSILNNLLDAPLIMLFLTYFSQTAVVRRKYIIAAIAFVIFEVITVLIFGLTREAITIILAPGLLMILVASLFIFIHQVKITVVYQKAAGKAVMAASLFFAYVGYSFIYVVFYYLDKSFQEDAKLVFFLVTIFSSISIAVGIFIERNRVRHLAELHTTRNELKALYGQEEKTTAHLETIVFNFDKKQWN